MEIYTPKKMSLLFIAGERDRESVCVKQQEEQAPDKMVKWLSSTENSVDLHPEQQIKIDDTLCLSHMATL